MGRLKDQLESMKADYESRMAESEVRHNDRLQEEIRKCQEEIKNNNQKVGAKTANKYFRQLIPCYLRGARESAVSVQYCLNSFRLSARQFELRIFVSERSR